VLQLGEDYVVTPAAEPLAAILPVQEGVFKEARDV
jgi:hypothetical protein